MPRVLAANPTPSPDPAAKQKIQHYETAVRLMREANIRRRRWPSKYCCRTMPATWSTSRVRLTACERQMKKNAISFQSPEEQYDYAISLLNTGYYEDAREQFDAILQKHPSADYAFYGLAVMHSLTSHAEECLEQLSRAIELNPGNRIQARLDSDFQEMFDDPRFTELLYPEVL